MSVTRMTRRGFLGAGAIGLVATGRLAGQAVQDSLAGRGERGTLFNPGAAGRPRDPSTADDNNLAIQAIERRIKCQCGCGLDVFTCRTTDFTCQTSPEMHRRVAASHNDGLTADQIVQQFVDQYGEQALMAPPAEGFNLAGYLVPGAIILLAGVLLVLMFLRRRRLAVATPTGPVLHAGTPPGGAAGSPEELARLERALAEMED